MASTIMLPKRSPAAAAAGAFHTPPALEATPANQGWEVLRPRWAAPTALAARLETSPPQAAIMPSEQPMRASVPPALPTETGALPPPAAATAAAEEDSGAGGAGG